MSGCQAREATEGSSKTRRVVATPPGWFAALASQFASGRPRGAVIRAAELLLERGYGKAPVFHTDDPAEFRDVLELTDAEIRDRLAAIRGLLRHGIDPLALPGPRGNGGHR